MDTISRKNVYDLCIEYFHFSQSLCFLSNLRLYLTYMPFIVLFACPPYDKQVKINSAVISLII